MQIIIIIMTVTYAILANQLNIVRIERNRGENRFPKGKYQKTQYYDNIREHDLILVNVLRHTFSE